MKKFQTFLIKTLLVIIPLTAGVLAYSWSVYSLSNYIYSVTAKPFLPASGSTTIPTHKLTTKPSQIEYRILKVPVLKMTAAKK